MNIKNILTHLIKAGRDSLHVEKTLREIGYADTPYYSLYGEICEAIYGLLGENTECFEESNTFAAMHDIYTPDEICAERLEEIFLSNPANTGLNIPKATLDLLVESADRRGVPLDRFIGLILSEWAVRELIRSI
jgi:hypothetical protein